MGQSADAMALETAMESRAGELRNGCLEGVEAVVQRQERVLAKGDDNGLLFASQGRGEPLLWPHGSVFHEGTFAPLLNGLWVDAVALGELQQAFLTILDRPTNRRRRAGATV